MDLLKVCSNAWKRELYISSFYQGVDPNKECVYFAGQSLGPQPIEAKALVDAEMEKWRKRWPL